MGKLRKKAKHKKSVRSGKYPRAVPPNTDSLTPSWQLAILDMKRNWGWDSVLSNKSKELVKQIVSKLASFEGMTWGELNKHPNTDSVSLDEICRDAQKRLKN